ncbi:hypothetical protein [Rhodocyclus tenuis]|uniref:hypothetical protein n=1 Tax=Rhodocyclus tenuis TaxID=1066 RepID=UPI00190450B9|nr:hypothetical protein [Rhodocyclus tenuis]MBK1678956.1 hypothetical protein [Rhodocyclus tenuis]
MKVKYLALAVAALSAAGTANAYTADATTVHLTGASAIRNNVAAAIKKLCVNEAGGALTVFKQGSSTTTLANQMAYVCSAPMAGTSITKIYHTTTGGSLNSILGMSNDVAKQQVPVNIASSSCAAPVIPTSGALKNFTVRANCGVDAAPAASNGGFSDLEFKPVREQVDILSSATDGFTIDDVTETATLVGQAFGVGVSESLYKGLQKAQGLSTDSTPAGPCTPGDSLPACQPSLSRADIVSLINNNLYAPQKNGAEKLSSGLTAGASIEYARRVTTSGTQSGAQVYFLGKGCLTGSNFGEFTVIGDEIAVGGTKTYGDFFKVSANSGTSDVLAKLGGSGYVFGFVSAENVAPATTTGWKFVKLNGVAISDGTATGLNKQNAIDGKYDYFVEAVSYKGPSAKTTEAQAAVIDGIVGQLAKTVADGGPETVGMFILPENAAGYDHATYPDEVSSYTRGGSSPNSCQPVSRPF